MCVCVVVPVPVKRTGATPERVAPIPCVISVEWERALDRPDRGNRSWPALSKVLRCATDRNRRGCRLLDCRPANESTRSSFYALDFIQMFTLRDATILFFFSFSSKQSNHSLFLLLLLAERFHLLVIVIITSFLGSWALLSGVLASGSHGGGDMHQDGRRGRNGHDQRSRSNGGRW